MTDPVIELLKKAQAAEEEHDRMRVDELRVALHKAIDEGDEVRERRYRDVLRLRETGKYPGQE